MARKAIAAGLAHHRKTLREWDLDTDVGKLGYSREVATASWCRNEKNVPVDTIEGDGNSYLQSFSPIRARFYTLAKLRVVFGHEAEGAI